MQRLVFALGHLLFAIQTPTQERRLPVLSANLDALLNFTQLWQWSSEDFEKAYVVKLADPEQQEKPLGLSSSPKSGSNVKMAWINAGLGQKLEAP